MGSELHGSVPLFLIKEITWARGRAPCFIMIKWSDVYFTAH